MAFVFYPKKTIKVKNLGWLLRNWKSVKSFKVSRLAIKYWEVRLEAFFDGKRYETNFADVGILWNFLNRPVFYGLKVDWFGTEYTLSKENGKREFPPIKKGALPDFSAQK